MPSKVLLKTTSFWVKRLNHEKQLNYYFLYAKPWNPRLCNSSLNAVLMAEQNNSTTFVSSLTVSDSTTTVTTTATYCNGVAWTNDDFIHRQWLNVRGLAWTIGGLMFWNCGPDDANDKAPWDEWRFNLKTLTH